MNGTQSELARFFRKFSTLLGAGVPILQALETCGKEAADEPVKAMIADLLASIREGSSLKTPMARHPLLASPSILAMVDVGEATGTIVNMLMNVAKGIEDGTLPTAITEENSPKERLTLFFRKLGMLIDSGLPVLRSLNTIRAETTCESMRTVINSVGGDIESGRTLKEAMARHPGVFAPSILTMVQAGENSGTLEKAMAEIVHAVESGTFPTTPSGAATAAAPGTVAPVDDDIPVIKLVNLILFESIKAKASDIHMESLDDGQLRIRYRIDGVLHDMERPPAQLRNTILSRVKIMAGMNPQEKRKPQDGRMQVSVAGKAIDIRVSVAPCTGGESVVMRVLERGNLRLPDLQSQGFTADNQAMLRSWCRKPSGIIIVTGPTGCGKTTTLYTLLQELNSPAVKIMTVEDPVEYPIDGICQMRVDVAQGVTFAAALRCIMRQAPNIVMIGETRDQETAHIAVQLALTGHLVFTSLHTIDAPSALRRLMDIGVEPFLVNSTVIGVLSQRLVRQICPDCREKSAPPEWVKGALKGEKLPDSFRGKGCPACRQFGYHGRIGIHELLTMGEKIKTAVARDATTEEIRCAAVASGMVTKRDDGLAKAATGITTIEEVLQVCQ